MGVVHCHEVIENQKVRSYSSLCAFNFSKHVSFILFVFFFVCFPIPTDDAVYDGTIDCIQRWMTCELLKGRAGTSHSLPGGGLQ